MEGVALSPPHPQLYIVYPWYTVTDCLYTLPSFFLWLWNFGSYSDVLVCQIKEESEDSGSLLMNTNNGLVVMTGKSQSRTTTSRTISISLTLQAQPLSRMKKRWPADWAHSTCSLQFKGLPWWSPSAPHCSTAIQPQLTLRQSSPSLHTTGDPMLRQHHYSPFIELLWPLPASSLPQVMFE